jgi:Family of unknown function (DUF6186)
MIGTVLWIVLLAACILIELLARRFPSRGATISQFGVAIASRRLGRIVLLLLWIFVGVHLFARYTIPRG